MRKTVAALVIGLLLGTAISALAKYESGTNDAESVVAYGYNGTSLVAVNVTAAGKLILAGS